MDLWRLEILTTGKASETWLQKAKEAALADTSRAQAWGITPENVDEVIQRRSQLLKSVFPALSKGDRSYSNLSFLHFVNFAKLLCKYNPNRCYISCGIYGYLWQSK